MSNQPKFLKVLNPCKENFDGMTPVSSECRHCKVCNTEVYDTTKITYREFLKISSNTKKRACFSFKQHAKGYIKFAPSLSTYVYNLGCSIFIYFWAIQNLYAQECKENTALISGKFESVTMGRIDTTVDLLLKLMEGRFGAIMMLLFGLSGVIATVFAVIKKKSKLLALGVVLILIGALFLFVRSWISLYFNTTQGIIGS